MNAVPADEFEKEAYPCIEVARSSRGRGTESSEPDGRDASIDDVRRNW
jgi:hypothetical protein